MLRGLQLGKAQGSLASPCFFYYHSQCSSVTHGASWPSASIQLLLVLTSSRLSYLIPRFSHALSFQALSLALRTDSLDCVDILLIRNCLASVLLTCVSSESAFLLCFLHRPRQSSNRIGVVDVSIRLATLKHTVTSGSGATAWVVCTICDEVSRLY